MSIAPIVRTVTVAAPPPRAFDLFTTRIGEWWPRSQSIGDGPLVDVTLEPRVGGRWFETNANGSTATWGDVLAWEPPARLVLAWRVGANFKPDPDLLTEVEVTFAAAQGGTLVTLEHRRLEAFGSDAPRLAAMLGGGWPTTVADFAHYADANV